MDLHRLPSGFVFFWIIRSASLDWIIWICFLFYGCKGSDFFLFVQVGDGKKNHTRFVGGSVVVIVLR